MNVFHDFWNSLKEWYAKKQEFSNELKRLEREAYQIERKKQATKIGLLKAQGKYKPAWLVSLISFLKEKPKRSKLKLKGSKVNLDKFFA